MKRSFHHRLINGPFEDPVLYVRLDRARRALLFDAGDVHALAPGDALKVTDILVTHTHLDHFMGFDQILRILLGRESAVNVYGPANIIDCVEGKLRGYTWNLIEAYPLELLVHAVDGEAVRSAAFRARESFRRVDMGQRTFDGLLIDEPRFRVRAASLSHGVQCMAYALEEEFHVNMDTAALERQGLATGPWLTELKNAVHAHAPETAAFDANGKAVTMAEVRDAVRIEEGQKLAYIADTAPTRDNIAKAIGLAQGATSLYCEAYFMDEDRSRAMDRHHLTGRMAGMIARLAGARHFVPMHFSPKYRGAERTPDVEAIEEYTSGDMSIDSI